MSHEIITEQIVLMGQRLLQSLLQQIQQRSPAWYALMKPLPKRAHCEGMSTTEERPTGGSTSFHIQRSPYHNPTGL